MMFFERVFIVHSPEIDIPEIKYVGKTKPTVENDQRVTQVMVPSCATSLCITLAILREAGTLEQTFEVASVTVKYPPNLAVLNNDGLVGTPYRWVGNHFTFRKIDIQS